MTEARNADFMTLSIRFPIQLGKVALIIAGFIIFVIFAAYVNVPDDYKPGSPPSPSHGRALI